MLPSKFPEVKKYPNLQSLLKKHIDMQFGELRVMLSQTGFNYPVSAYMFDMLAGVSVCFMDASEEGVTNASGRTARYQKLLNVYYPREKDLPINRNELIEVLYNAGRNSLAHSLGLDLPTGRYFKYLDFAKRGKPPGFFTAAEIEMLETSPTRPSFAPPTVTKKTIGSKTRHIVTTSSLYWGLYRVLTDLFSDKGQLRDSDKLASKFLRHL